MCLRLAVLIALATLPVRGTAADEPAKKLQFENRPGWAWIVGPHPKQDGPEIQMKSGWILLFEEGKDDKLIVVFASPGGAEPTDVFHRCRPIAFDMRGSRHELKAVVRGINRVAGQEYSVVLDRWESDPEKLPAGKVAHVGLEGLTTEGVRMIAKDAARKLQQKGIDALPFPVVGEPFTFKLTDVNGKAIDSRELKGKVVLLDFWATWCFPCMQKMPKLKELYKRWHDDGFEVVGVSFDKDREARLKAVEKLGIPWRQTMPPADEETRDLWNKATGLRGIPRLLLIDADGILRADCSPEELQEHVTALMKEMSEEENTP